MMMIIVDFVYMYLLPSFMVKGTKMEIVVQTTLYCDTFQMTNVKMLVYTENWSVRKSQYPMIIKDF